MLLVKKTYFLSGREADVGFGAVVVVRHVDEVLGLEDSGLPEGGFVERALRVADHVRVEELDPLAVRCVGDLAGVAAVAGEEVEVFGEVEVNRPLVALHVVGGALAGLEVVAGEEEVFALGKLPVVPDGLAVESPELVAGDLHDHGALVDEGVLRAVGVDEPDAIDLLPHAFVAVHEEGGVGGREEQVVDPVGGVEKWLDGAGLFAVGAGLEADGEEDEGNAGCEAALHHLALVVGLNVCSAEVGGGVCICWAWDGCGSDEGVRRVGIAAGNVGFVVGAGAECLIGVDAGDEYARWQVDELADFAGVGVGLVDGVDVGVGVHFGEEDAVGLVADDDGVGCSHKAGHR